MIRVMRSTLALVVLVLAVVTTPPASASPLVEVVDTPASGMNGTSDQRWGQRASEYDSKCTSSPADPGEYAQCITKQVDDSIFGPEHARDATCVLASLVSDDKLGLANCRFAAQHVGRTAFDAVYTVTENATEAAMTSFKHCHASFCDGGCSQGVVVGMLVATSEKETMTKETQTKQIADAFSLCLAMKGLGGLEEDAATSTTSTTPSSTFTPSPVTCATGIGQALFAVTKSLPAAVDSCSDFSIFIAGQKAENDPAVDVTAVETRLKRSCVSGVLLRNALAKVTKMKFTGDLEGSAVEGDSTSTTINRTSSSRLRRGLNKVCSDFYDDAAVVGNTVLENNALSSVDPDLCSASLGRAMAMITIPSFVDDDAERERVVDENGGRAETLCSLLSDDKTKRACSSAALVAAAAREVSQGAHFAFCQSMVEDGFGVKKGGDDYDDVKRSTDESSTGSTVSTAEGDTQTNAVRVQNPSNACENSSSDFSFKGCAIAEESEAFHISTENGGSPESVSLPFCGEVVQYPIGSSKKAKHRAEDDGIKTVYDNFLRLLKSDDKFDSDSLSECAAAVKQEMCRTAFSACDGKGGDLEYCSHSHVQPFGAFPTTVGICANGDVTETEQNSQKETATETDAKEPSMGARVVCGARWGGVACFKLPPACGPVSDTGDGTCPTVPKTWQAMADWCFYAAASSDTFTEYFSRKASSTDAAIETPASLERECAGMDVSRVNNTNDSLIKRNTSETVTETFQIVKDTLVDMLSMTPSAEHRNDPRRSAQFTRSDREKGGAVFMYIAQGMVAGSVIAAAWSCTRGWCGGGDGSSSSQNGGLFPRWGSRRSPNGGPSFFRLKEKSSFKEGDEDSELNDLPTTTKGGTLASLPKRGKGSPEKNGLRRIAEAPF